MDYTELGKTGERIPVLGMGTYGDAFRQGDAYTKGVEALRRGIEFGMTLIDTAEIYGPGRSEEIVGEAVKGIRDRVFIATKVSPDNAAYDDLLKSAEKSLRRLNVSYIDLYQIHWWSSRIPVKETMRAMERLIDEGKIRYVGVSNFSVEQTQEAREALSKTDLVSNQVLYSLLERGIEIDLLPYCQTEKITVIAYAPIARGKIFRGRISRRLVEVGKKYGKTPVQVALNWLLTKPEVIAIPKAAKIEHIEENAGAVGWHLSEEDIRTLET